MCDFSWTVGRATAAGSRVNHGHTKLICMSSVGLLSPKCTKAPFSEVLQLQTHMQSHVLFMQCMAFKRSSGNRTLSSTFGSPSSSCSALEALEPAPHRCGSWGGTERCTGAATALRRSESNFQHLIRPKEGWFWGHRLRNEARDVCWQCGREAGARVGAEAPQKSCQMGAEAAQSQSQGPALAGGISTPPGPMCIMAVTGTILVPGAPVLWDALNHPIYLSLGYAWFD